MHQREAILMTNTVPMVRSSIYRLLSLAFKYPAPDMFSDFRNGNFFTELWDNFSKIPHQQDLVDERAELLGGIQQGLNRISFLDFQVAYTQTFDVGAPKPPCPPYEGLYRQGVERTALMIEVSEFYKYFGLGMSKEEGKRELPDHLSAELEFLHFLTFKEAQALEEDTPDLLNGYVLAQKEFLERHMVSWLPKFCESVQRSARMPLFKQLAGITLTFVLSDFERTKSRLEELQEP